jgi:hypothetical protein
MPVVLCSICAKGITLPFPWKLPTFTCPHCAHVFSGRKSAPLHLRHFKVPLTASTAAEIERIVPIVNKALGVRVSREQFFALAVAALAAKFDPATSKADDTAEGAVLSHRLRGRDGQETGVAEATGQVVPSDCEQ